MHVIFKKCLEKIKEKKHFYDDFKAEYMNKKFANVDAYISSFPKETQDRLEEIRLLIKQTWPEAIESISYNIPGYKLHGLRVYFAGYNHHIGFYPGAMVLAKFSSRLTAYKISKGTVQFPLNTELPTELIVKMIDYKVNENDLKANLKRKNR